MDPGWERVAHQIGVQRVRRGYRTMAAFAEATGLSMTTIDALEHARQDGYHASTLTTVEHALGWQPGSIERIRSGRDPKPVTDPEMAALLDVWPRLSQKARRAVLGVAAQLAGS